MINSSISNHSLNLVGKLYRLASQAKGEFFREHALLLIKEAIPFDSAMWATAQLVHNDPRIHGIHVINRPLEMITRDYELIKHQDLAMSAYLANPGKPIRMSLDEIPDRANGLKSFIRDHNIDHVMGTVAPDPAANTAHGIVLWRGRK